MADYKHGAYGDIRAVGTRVSDESQSAIVYVGTAPVHQIEGGAANVNVPVVVNNIAEARAKFGYSDDWASYTLCEAMHVHFDLNGVGPLVLINVLDPATHRSETKVTKSLTPKGGKVTITNAENIILDSVVVKTGSGESASTKVKGTDYELAYNIEKQQIVIRELTSGALGTAALTVEYSTVTPSAVTNADVIGTSDGIGLNTGLFVLKNVYQVTGYIPAYLACPGFSSIPAVHSAMYQNSVKINGHWDAYMFVDLPISDNGTAITLATAATWKSANGYDHENETVYFPLVQGTDGKVYHLSVLAAANFQGLLLDQDGIPYKTASNTPCAIVEKPYMGASVGNRVFDDYIINQYLNKNGIASAAFVGGRWAIWGCHSADYDQENADSINVSETYRMMLYYISNDFQHRRTEDVDQPMTRNDLESIIAEEQTRIDALLKIGALTYGEVSLNADAVAKSDVMQGDYSFLFNVTTTPLAKSLTAIVNWTDDGFVTYFEQTAD
ncbi:MAG: hypothetical protein IJ649_01110 [Oscillospiraceae bacterium]|nr:hypothetical protein [Oscillospiraceae bacterium]